MTIFLHGLALKNYRGIGDTAQVMSEFKSFNFFIGANNAGKSTILNFISRYLPPKFQGRMTSQRSPAYDIHALERHSGSGGADIWVAIGVPQATVFDRIVTPRSALTGISTVLASLRKVIRALSGAGNLIWLEGKVPYGESLSLLSDSEPVRKALEHYSWRDLWTNLTGTGGGGLKEHWIPETLKEVEKSAAPLLPTVKLIPAIRQIGPKGASFDDYSGVGLIDQLAAIQNPEHDKREDRVKFDRINGFLQNVTGKSEAQIEIPYSRDHVLVHMDDRVLPLESLGTGIHEVIMIAAFCTLAESQIVCIEEPEIHLHPALQRKLIRYLAANTDNQYFIATHSAAFIDTPDAAIFHVYQEDGTTRIKEAILNKDRFAICLDLGYRASDIIQSNAVIWVEGPSDRIYLNHWIKLAAPDLIERVHYSIMFYGGRLLSHLSANDEEVTEFIQLRDLNRNVAILIDSDKKSVRDKINATKQRLKDEFAKGGGVAWVTKGREVENYIDHARLQAGVAATYGANYGKGLEGGQFDHALYFERSQPKRRRKATVAATTSLRETDVDKVKVAHAVANDGGDDLDVLDLRQRVEELVQMIRHANG